MELEKRVTTKQTEDDFVNMIIEGIRKNKMTISNLKEVTNRVVSYLESNAILESEDSENPKSSD